MNEKMKKLLSVYKEQTGEIFRGFGPSYNDLYSNASAPVLFNDIIGGGVTEKALGTSNEVDLWFAENGLFADCCLDYPVMSLLSRPLKSVGMLFPMVPDNNTVITRAALTGNYDLAGSRPDGVCEPGPTAGNFGSCVQEFRKGRISMSSKTAELDALIENACRGVNREQFYFVGGNRGVPGVGPKLAADQTNEIFSSAIYRELHTLSTRMNMDLMRSFWIGDPANSTTNGGYKEFRGVLNYIVDDYAGGKPWVTASGGADCSELNSDVKVFDACVGSANTDGNTLYALLEEIEYEVTTRASQFGVTADWVIVAPSIILRALTKALPCEMISGNCGSGSSGVNITANDSYLVEARRQMMRDQTIDLNGKTYRLVEDDFMPVVETVDGVTGEATYSSDIIMMPVRIDGEPTVEWHYKDYRGFVPELSMLGALTSDLTAGTSDNGAYHTVLQRDLRCFLVETKMETTPVIHSGFSALAGKVTLVKGCTLQAHTVPNTFS